MSAKRQTAAKPKSAFHRMMRRSALAFDAFLGVLVVATLIAAWHFNGRATFDTTAQPPETWVQAASAADRLAMPGRDIAYWADPAARYSNYATKAKRKPQALVIHHTAAKPVLNLVRYGHTRDFSRGGGAFGYHFYIGRHGAIVQGAPLSKRTNHIKRRRHPRRTAVATHLWSGNTIGISLVGGCDPLMRPKWPRWQTCSDEYVTQAQVSAGLALIKTLRTRYGVDCEDVYGHGELQTDRANFEGATLVTAARSTCDVQVSDRRQKSVAKTLR